MDLRGEVSCDRNRDRRCRDFLPGETFVDRSAYSDRRIYNLPAYLATDLGVYRLGGETVRAWMHD